MYRPGWADDAGLQVNFPVAGLPGVEVKTAPGGMFDAEMDIGPELAGFEALITNANMVPAEAL